MTSRTRGPSFLGRVLAKEGKSLKRENRTTPNRLHNAAQKEKDSFQRELPTICLEKGYGGSQGHTDVAEKNVGKRRIDRARVFLRTPLSKGGRHREKDTPGEQLQIEGWRVGGKVKLKRVRNNSIVVPCAERREIKKGAIRVRCSYGSGDGESEWGTLGKKIWLGVRNSPPKQAFP